MRSRITISVFSIMIAVLSLSIGGCSGNDTESSEKSTQSNIGQIINNSNNSTTSEDSATGMENSGTGSEDNSSGDSAQGTPESAQPSGTPTIFIGPDGEPVYEADVKKIINYYETDFNKTAAEITDEDEGAQIICEGFQYFKEPAGTAYNSYENPEMFDGFEFKDEIPENNNAWKRVNVGDEICGLKLKYAVSQFIIGYGDENDFEERGTYYNCKQPDVYQYAENGKLVEFEGSLTLTGFLSSSARSYYFPDGGFMGFCPVEDKLPVMCYDDFKTEPNTYSVMSGSDATCVVGESLIMINIKKPQGDVKNQQEIEFVDEKPGIGDTVLARVTISNITYAYGGYSADFSDVEILSDVLAHEDDSI